MPPSDVGRVSSLGVDSSILEDRDVGQGLNEVRGSRRVVKHAGALISAS